MSEEQHSRLENKIDSLLGNIAAIQVDIAAMKANHENRLQSLESFVDNFTKIVVGVLVAIIAGLLLVVLKGGLKF